MSDTNESSSTSTKKQICLENAYLLQVAEGDLCLFLNC